SAVVSMEVFHDIRHGGFQSPQLDQHRFAALIPNGAVLSPTTKKLRKREGINIIAFGRIVAVSHRIGLDGTDPGSVRRTGTSRHGMAQERARTGGGKSLLGMLQAREAQQTVNLCRTDL